MRHLLFKFRFIGLIALALVGGIWPVGAQAAQAATASVPGLNSAGTFAILSAAPLAGGAVTCTTHTITGDVGSSGLRAAVVQKEGCAITGAIIAPVPAQVVRDFNTAYGKYVGIHCDQTLTGTLASVTLTPGVYCFDAAAALTGTLTLRGPSNGIWIFKIGAKTAPPTGALTGTNFSVVMDGGQPCNVNWWVAEAATMTTSTFVGTILAGAAITITDSTFTGSALAKAAVTLKGTDLVGCNAGGTVVCRNGGGDDEDEDGGQSGESADKDDEDAGRSSKTADKDGDKAECKSPKHNEGDENGSNDEHGSAQENPGHKAGSETSSVEAKDNSANHTSAVAAKESSTKHTSTVVMKQSSSTHKSTAAAKESGNNNSNGKSKSNDD